MVVLPGGGGGLPIEKPELTAKISGLRLERAAELDIDTLVSACPWSERPLGEAGDAQDIDVVDLHELFAQSLGITVGGSRGDVGDRRLAQERSGVPGRPAHPRERLRLRWQRLRMRRQRLRMRGH